MFPSSLYTCQWWLGFAFYTLVAILQVHAGEGATFVLMNATPYTWTLSSESSYQMNDWSFPNSIAAGTFAKVYVEWDQNIFDDESDDGGEAVYALSGTSYTFQLQARAPNGVFHLQAYLNRISTAGNPLGSTIDLGWLHDQNNLFVLSGNSSYFSSNNPPSNWMQASLPVIGGRLIRELCIPGSHDAGMSTLNGSTLFSNELNTLTQTVSIYNQLVFGARYFDIRPVKSSGIYKAGHYSNTVVDGWQTPVGWQGGNGQSIASIISDVNSFTQGNSELIFIKLSHDLDTDGDYESLTQTQWNTLLTQMQGINHLYIASPTADFTRFSLKSFIQNGPAVVVLVSPGDEHVNISPFQGKGFYWANVSLPVYDNYTGTNDLGTMMSDQIQKLSTERPTPDSPMFLLSWTLTMSPVTAAAVGGTIPPLRAGEPTIVGYAAQANNALATGLLPSVTTSVFPNILYVDNFASSNITAVVMAVNALSQNFNVVPPGQPWAECGGIGWTGATTCVANYACTYVNQFYSQCIPA